MSFVKNVIKASPEPIHLIQCRDEDGFDCFYFLMCKPHQLRALAQAREAVIDLHQYGRIVHSGFGLEPGPEDLDFMIHTYGYQPA